MKLEKELQVLARARQAEVQAAEAKIKSKEAEIKAKDQLAKAKADAEAHKTEMEAQKAEVDAKHWEQWAQQMEAWAKQYEAQVNSNEFKQWQKEMELWAKEFAEAHQNAESSGDVFTPATKHRPMPAMPPMPHMPAEVVAPNVAAPVPPQPPTAVVPKVGPHPTSKSDRIVAIKKDKDGKYLATTEMHFVSKVQPGSPFVVRNSLGNITLQPGKDSTCDVRAVIRGKAETDAEARAMVEQVSMNMNSSDEGYYIKPVKQDGDKWNNLNVDFYITVPLGVLTDVKSDLGNIEISNLQGQIKAATDLGSIKAVNTTGEIELFTKMGKIEFIAPKNLSAKLQAQTKMGEIESELPLEIDRSDMFKRTAEGTIGTGQANIKMSTDMGKISLKWQPSSQDELKI